MTDIGKAINLDLNQPQFNKVSCKNGNLLAHQLQRFIGRGKKIERTRGNSLQILFVFANLMSCSGCDLNFSRYLFLEGPSFILFLFRFQLLRLLLRLSIIIAMHLCRVLMATSRIISYQYVPHRGLDDFKMALNLEIS